MAALPTLRLWVLAIDHRQGTTISLHRTKRGARQSLRDYVAAEWHPVFADTAPPEINGRHVRRYFEYVRESESYFIERYKVEN